MSKIQINAKLENKTDHIIHEVTTTGLYHNHSILYQDGDNQMVLKLEKDKLEMKRIQNEDVLRCEFISLLSTKGLFDMKSIPMKFHIQIKTKKLVIEENHIKIEYEMILEKDLPKLLIYQLDYEVIP